MKSCIETIVTKGSESLLKLMASENNSIIAVDKC